MKPLVWPLKSAPSSWLPSSPASAASTSKRWHASSSTEASSVSRLTPSGRLATHSAHHLSTEARISSPSSMRRMARYASAHVAHSSARFSGGMSVPSAAHSLRRMLTAETSVDIFGKQRVARSKASMASCVLPAWLASLPCATSLSCCCLRAAQLVAATSFSVTSSRSMKTLMKPAASAASRSYRLTAARSTSASSVARVPSGAVARHSAQFFSMRPRASSESAASARMCT